MVFKNLHKVIKLPRELDCLDLFVCFFSFSKDSWIEICALYKIAIILCLVNVRNVTAASLLFWLVVHKVMTLVQLKLIGGLEHPLTFTSFDFQFTDIVHRLHLKCESHFAFIYDIVTVVFVISRRSDQVWLPNVVLANWKEWLVLLFVNLQDFAECSWCDLLRSGCKRLWYSELLLIDVFLLHKSDFGISFLYCNWLHMTFGC